MAEGSSINGLVPLMIVLMALSLGGCGSYLVVNSYGAKGDIEFGSGKEILHGIFDQEERTGNLFGRLDDPDPVPLKVYYKDSDYGREGLSEFSVTTTYRLRDILWHLIPFYSSRTIVYQGKVKRSGRH